MNSQHDARAPVARSPSAERILDAAESAFAARGFDGASLGDVADAVGIRPPSLYKHFAGKQALFEAVLQRLLDPYFEALEHSLQLPTGPGEADANLRQIVARYWRTPNLARLVQQAALAGGDQLDLLVERWYGPLFERAARFSVVPVTTRGRPPRRGSAQHTRAMRLALTFHAFMSGYVTLAPLHARLLGEDPLSPLALEQQAAMLRLLVSASWAP